MTATEAMKLATFTEELAALSRKHGVGVGGNNTCEVQITAGFDESDSYTMDFSGYDGPTVLWTNKDGQPK